MSEKKTDLNFIWKNGLKFYADAGKLRAEGDKLWAESGKLRAERDKLWAESDKLREESDKLREEEIIDYGNIKLK